MLIGVSFLLNSAGNFVLGVVLSALLGPAEFGRYATVALAGLTLAGGAFDWLRYSIIRFSAEHGHRPHFAASLEAAYLGVALTLYAGVGVAHLCGVDFGLGTTLLLLTPLYTVAISRVDYCAAHFRARGQSRAFAGIFVARQSFCALGVVAVALWGRDAAMAVGTMAGANLAAAVALAPWARSQGAHLTLARAAEVKRFLVYAQPLVVSMVLYALISLINRQVALARLGAAETGQFSLAFDVSQRLFQALYQLPELLLFQIALRRDREEGRAAAKAQLALNATLALGVFLPISIGYFTMAPTFEQLVVPALYRGEFARLSLEMAPGLVAYGALIVAVNPVFQLAQRTWPVTVVAVFALALDAILLLFTNWSASVDGLACAYSVSVAAAFVVAAAAAFRDAAVRPRLRDLAAMATALTGMALAARPFNGLASPLLGALGGVGAGGVVYLSVLAAADFAGLRSKLVARLSARRDVLA